MKDTTIATNRRGISIGATGQHPYGVTRQGGPISSPTTKGDSGFRYSPQALPAPPAQSRSGTGQGGASARARQLVTQSAVPAFAVDEKNRIVAWNDRARESFGLAPRSVLGRDSGDTLEIRDTLGNRVCPRNCAFHSMAQRGEKIAGYVIQIRSAGGDLVPIYGSAEIVKTEGLRSSYEIVFFLQPERRRQTVDAALERLVHRRLAVELRTQQGHSPSATDPELTARQRQVLLLLATGKTTTEIAGALGVSVNTIRHHMQNILDNLDCHSQAEAVAKAIRNDLI